MAQKSRVTRWIPLLILVIALGCVIYFRLYRYFTFEMLQQNHKQLVAWTQQYYVLVVLAYMAIYIAAVAISVPGATILTITSGFLFGIIPGTIYVVISATIGACLLFLAVKTALGSWLESKAQSWIRKMEQGFQKDAFNYLLFLRLVPLFPFWVVNIVPALLDVRLRIFLLATFIGIIPGSFVYVLVGNGLGSVLASGKTPDLGIIFKPSVLIPILALAVLSLVPIIYKRIKKSKT